jgi:hypothetical protein
MVYYYVFIIRIFLKKDFKKSNNYWMLYKTPFESLTNLQSINVHITFFLQRNA